MKKIGLGVIKLSALVLWLCSSTAVSAQDIFTFMQARPPALRETSLAEVIFLGPTFQEETLQPSRQSEVRFQPVSVPSGLP